MAIIEDSLRVKYFEVNGTGDAGGNFIISLPEPGKMIPVIYATFAGATDGNYNLFFSSVTQRWYIHTSNLINGACIGNATIRGRVYYVEYLV